MKNEKLPPPQWIDTPKALYALAKDLSHSPRLAVDTESNSLYAYQEQVCLLQFSTPHKDYLVDTLALQDLSPLNEIFENPVIEKIFHAAEYDALCLYRDFRIRITNLFDTMIAARILGRKAVGLGSLLAEEFGIQQEKRYQRANWGKRPLPEHLLAYARLDTRYLIPLREKLGRELKARGLWELAEEDFARASLPNQLREGNSRGHATTDPWRIRGAHHLNPHQAAVLKELCIFRDKIARRRNRPLFKVIGDKTLLEIATQLPANREQLSQIHGMSKGQMKRYGEALLEAVQRGLKKPPLARPKKPPVDMEFAQRLENLRQWRKRTARKMGVESDVILPRDLMYEIARRNPQSQETLSELLHSVPWRRARFGDKILHILHVKERT